MRIPSICLLVVALALGGCSGATVSPSPSPTPTPVPTEAPTAAPTPTLAPTATPVATAAFACPFVVPAAGVPTNRVVKVAVVARDGYDQVIFTLGKNGSGSGAPPTIEVAAATPPFMKSPSGFPLTVAGETFLRVTFRETIVAGEDGTPTYDGPRDLTPAGTVAVKEVVQDEAFEGVVDWLIGLEGQGCGRAVIDPVARTVTLELAR